MDVSHIFYCECIKPTTNSHKICDTAMSDCHTQKVTLNLAIFELFKFEFLSWAIQVFIQFWSVGPLREALTQSDMSISSRRHRGVWWCKVHGLACYWDANKQVLLRGHTTFHLGKCRKVYCLVGWKVASWIGPNPFLRLLCDPLNMTF